MKKERNLNVAQAFLVGCSRMTIDDDELCVKFNIFIREHRIIAGLIFTLIALACPLIGPVAGFICPADDIVADSENILANANLTNEACKVEEA